MLCKFSITVLLRITSVFTKNDSFDFQDLLPLQRPSLIDVKLQPVKPLNKQLKSSQGSKLGNVTSTNDFRINPTQSVLMMPNQQSDMTRAQESVSSLHAPDRLQPVKRGPSRLTAPHGLDLGYKGEQRLSRLSPDPLRPVQMGKMGALTENDRTKKLLDHNSGKETFL